MPKVIKYPVKLSIRISVDQANRLDAIAKYKGVETSEAIRRLLEMPKKVVQEYI